MANNDERILVDNPGKVKSDVWKNFGFWKVKGEDGRPFIDKSKAVCKLCNFEINYHTNTTNMANHIRNKHAAEQSKAASQPKIMAAMQSKVQKLPFNSPRAKGITEAIGEFLASDLVPLSIVEGKGFEHMCKAMVPAYEVPSRKYFTETLLPRIYNETAVLIRDDIKSAEFVAITHDIWTSISTEAYRTVTCHLITET